MAEIQKISMTPEGYQHLQDELKSLKAIDRREVIFEIAEARKLGVCQKTQSIMRPVIDKLSLKGVFLLGG